MMQRKQLLLLSLMLGLFACSSQGPVPTDHYYRLPELRDVNPDEKLAEAISVIAFQADGLHKERAVLYSKDGIELKQYHYHHWTDSPHRLLQQRLAERLRMAKAADIVLTTFEGNSDVIIKGQIKAFERLKDVDNDSVKVSLDLRVDLNHGNLPIFYKEYTQVINVLEDASIISVINAFNLGVNAIYDEFYDDLKDNL